MFTIKTYPYDCTRKCRCLEHAKNITSALTKRYISDEKLAAYIAKTCCNFTNIVDAKGRSAVHIAASVGRYAILEWLINNGAVITKPDSENGLTPLHKALYYGCVDCAVLLIRHGASLESLDKDSRFALHYVCRKRESTLCIDPEENDLLVWGSNKNYNLGIDNIDDPIIKDPQYVDFFRKSNIRILKVAIGVYHSCFVDKLHNLYVVGHGEGGRLGMENENTLVVPKRLKVVPKSPNSFKTLYEMVTAISVSSKHTLVLTGRAVVHATGLNDYSQLGIPGIGPKSTAFKEIPTFRQNRETDLQGVIARDNHSLAWSSSDLYVWGANNGQFGLGQDIDILPVPQLMKLAPNAIIHNVQANDVATVVCVDSINLMLYYNSKIKPLKYPNFEPIRSIAMCGGNNQKSPRGSATALKVAVITDSNNVYIWYENTQAFYRCFFPNVQVCVEKILMKGNQLLVLSYGDVFEGHSTQVPFDQDTTAQKSKNFELSTNTWQVASSYKQLLSSEHKIRMDLKRIPLIDRAVDIFTNTEFTSFAVLQESHLKYFKIPNLGPEEYSFKKLYYDVREDDKIHDLVYIVEGIHFPVHKFIIYSRSPGLRRLSSSFAGKELPLNLEGLTAKLFDLMLKHIYMNHFPNHEDFEEVRKSLGDDSYIDRIVVTSTIMKFAINFGLEDLHNYLKQVIENLKDCDLDNDVELPDRRQYRISRVYPSDLPELFDVRIVCSDGVVIGAHKCMLVSRLEYFSVMFSNLWLEMYVVEMSDIMSQYMWPILEFTYSYNVELFRKQNYSEAFLYNLIVLCDQFFIERLRRVSEIALLHKISLRKCGALLQFACVYHCDTLKMGCLDYICQNLVRVLSVHSLENCEPETLKCVNEYYRDMFPEKCMVRIVKPAQDAVEDEVLMSFVDDFTVDLNERMEGDTTVKKMNAKNSNPGDGLKGTTRQYEKAAISSMLEKIEIDGDGKPVNSMELEASGQEPGTDSQDWTEVKAKQKKKSDSDTDTDAMAETLEEILTDLFTKFEQTTKPTLTISEVLEIASTEAATSSLASPKGYNLNLSDFATIPPSARISQKERKRLFSLGASSASQQGDAVLLSKQKSLSELPVQTHPNAWRLQDTPTTSKYAQQQEESSSPEGNYQDYDPIERAKQNHIDSVIQKGQSLNDDVIARIFLEEREDRHRMDNMFNRSLELNQIEDQAVADLEKFYNVDDVDDETSEDDL